MANIYHSNWQRPADKRWQNSSEVHQEFWQEEYREKYRQLKDKELRKLNQVKKKIECENLRHEELIENFIYLEARYNKAKEQRNLIE